MQVWMSKINKNNGELSNLTVVSNRNRQLLVCLNLVNVIERLTYDYRTHVRFSPHILMDIQSISGCLVPVSKSNEEHILMMLYLLTAIKSVIITYDKMHRFCFWQHVRRFTCAIYLCITLLEPFSRLQLFETQQSDGQNQVRISAGENCGIHR